MVWLVLMACHGECGANSSGASCDPGEDDSVPPVTDDSSVDDSGDTGKNLVCHNGDELLVEAPKKEGVAHWEWNADPRFEKNGGVIPDEDAPSITVTCPACVEGTTEYPFEVDFSDEKDRGLGFAYVYVTQECED